MSVVELPKGEPTDTPFAIGHVVHLRSGGAHMTVRKTSIKAKGVVTVTVDWMDEADTLCSAEFDERQLQFPAEKDND